MCALQTYLETRGHNFALNATFDEVKSESYDALVIPGGRAPEYLSIDPKVVALVKEFVAAKKPVGALCHGPLILAAADVLKVRRNPLCFTKICSVEKFLSEHKSASV